LSKKIKKVLLFIPPALTFKDDVDVNPLPPLGLGYLGAVLENHNIEVKIVDCLIEGWHTREDIAHNTLRIGLPFKEVGDIISDFNPDMVGVNSLFTRQRENAHHIYKLAKEFNPAIVTVAGGAHPSVMPELVMSDPNVDFAVLGEGEDTIIKLIDALEGRGDIADIDGIGFRTQNQIRINPKTKFITDVDTIPFPARHLLNMEKYIGLRESHGTRIKQRFSPVMTSRGCPAGCTFCSAHKVWGRKYRARSPENVLAEFRHLKEVYSIEELIIEDDNLTLNKDRARKIFDLMIQEKLGFVWDTPNGIAAWALDEPLIDKMKESGCYKLNLALESGSQYVVDNIIKKPLNLEKGKHLARYARSIGLDISIFLIVGMPGETQSQIWESFKMAAELEAYLPTISIATPYPGTAICEICKEHNYLPANFSLDDLHALKYSISTEDWSTEELRKLITSGKQYLLRKRLQRHPLQGIKFLWDTFTYEPSTFPIRAINFVRGRE
jgi:magnesium-protoporphyrin IX monomethyl ester (oxidative) cyclase